MGGGVDRRDGAGADTRNSFPLVLSQTADLGKAFQFDHGDTLWAIAVTLRRESPDLGTVLQIIRGLQLHNGSELDVPEKIPVDLVIEIPDRQTMRALIEAGEAVPTRGVTTVTAEPPEPIPTLEASVPTTLTSAPTPELPSPGAPFVSGVNMRGGIRTMPGAGDSALAAMLDDDFDDGAVRALVRSGAQLAEATPGQNRRMLEQLIDGWTTGGDKRAALTILQHAKQRGTLGATLQALSQSEYRGKVAGYWLDQLVEDVGGKERLQLLELLGKTDAPGQSSVVAAIVKVLGNQIYNARVAVKNILTAARQAGRITDLRQALGNIILPDGRNAFEAMLSVYAADPDIVKLTSVDSPTIGADVLIGQAVKNFAAGYQQGAGATVEGSVPRASIFDLVDGYPGTVGLPQALRQVLRQMSDSQAETTIRRIIGDFEAVTGVKLAESVVNAVIASPDSLTSFFKLTPKQMSQGFLAINMRNNDEPVESPNFRLPKNFNFGTIDSVVVERPVYEVKEIAPGLLRGSTVSNLDDEAAKQNIVLAEVFDRLGGNANPRGERFSVNYNGVEYRRIDTFVRALVDAGHEVEATVSHRIANFAELKTRAADGTLLDVPAPLFVRTGIVDENGEEAVVPAVHFELIFSIKPGPNVNGQAIAGDIRWFQGASATGFFPVGLAEVPAWLGSNLSEPITGDKALSALQLAGLLSDVINDAARDQDLAAAGYGVTGVCNDTVAIIQHALFGRTTAYPLLMQDETLTDKLQQRLSDDDPRDDQLYMRLLDSIVAVPSDTVMQPDAADRALASFPWVEGTEVFKSSIAARRILEAKVTH